MGYYEGATICLNGHVSSSTKACSQKYCSKCGKETFSKCTNCGAMIRGDYQADGIVAIGFKYNIPYYCHECGSPYPWTEKILDNAVELLALDGDLDDNTKDIIKTAIPALIVESSDTPLAAARYKKIIKSASTLVADALRQLLIDVVSETARKMIF